MWVSCRAWSDSPIMVIRQSNENNLPRSQLEGSQFSWCLVGLSEKHWVFTGALLPIAPLCPGDLISLCVYVLYGSRGKCHWGRFCWWVWSGKATTRSRLPWYGFITDRHSVNASDRPKVCCCWIFCIPETCTVWTLYIQGLFANYDNQLTLTDHFCFVPRGATVTTAHRVHACATRLPNSFPVAKCWSELQREGASNLVWRV